MSRWPFGKCLFLSACAGLQSTRLPRPDAVIFWCRFGAGFIANRCHSKKRFHRKREARRTESPPWRFSKTRVFQGFLGAGSYRNLVRLCAIRCEALKYSSQTKRTVMLRPASPCDAVQNAEKWTQNPPSRSRCFRFLNRENCGFFPMPRTSCLSAATHFLEDRCNP